MTRRARNGRPDFRHHSAASARHPKAVKVADAHYPGWREFYKDRMFTGYWKGGCFVPVPPAFKDEPPDTIT